MTELDNLQAAVTKINGEADSTIALVNGLSAYIVAHKTDPVALQAFADALTAKADALGAAVAANPVPA